MSDKSKRPWFRFHLLTAMLMMFAAGGFVWANTLPQRYDLIYNSKTDSYYIDTLEEPDYYVRCYGWPLSFFAVIEFEKHFLPKPFALDLLALGGGIAGVAFVCELILRRREARQRSLDRQGPA